MCLKKKQYAPCANNKHFWKGGGGGVKLRTPSKSGSALIYIKIYSSSWIGVEATCYYLVLKEYSHQILANKI